MSDSESSPTSPTSVRQQQQRARSDHEETQPRGRSNLSSSLLATWQNSGAWTKYGSIAVLGLVVGFGGRFLYTRYMGSSE